MLPDEPKTGRVKHVLFANYVTTNSAFNALSLIDVMDGLNVAQFPIDLRLFVVVFLRDAAGDFTFSLHVAGDRATASVEESHDLYIPAQTGPKTNIAVPTPIMHIVGPTKLVVTLLADRAPFHQENFPIMPLGTAPPVDEETISALTG